MGGGARGIALAGALKRLEEGNIRILGYAGVSVGSAVAVLHAIGYKADEIRQMLLETSLKDFLDGFDGNLSLQSMLNDLPRLRLYNIIKIIMWWKRYKIGSLRKRIEKEFGIYDGVRLHEWITSKIEARAPRDDKGACTFGLLQEKNILVKIIAANLKRRRFERFDPGTFGPMEIGDAVRASTAIPFFFKPVVAFGNFYVDGGIVSNFPLWLFARESKESGYPILGLRLEGKNSQKIDTVRRFCFSVLNTTLEGSNDIQNLDMQNVFQVEIKTKSYGALDFDLSEQAKNELFNFGYEAMDKFIKEA